MTNSNDLDKGTEPVQPLTRDPFYYGTVGLFAFITSVLSIMLTQTLILPVIQSVFLTIFIAIPLRKGLWRRARNVMALWTVLTLLIVATMTRISPSIVEASLPVGFVVRTDLLAWVYGADAYPSWLFDSPMSPFTRLLGITIGSLVTGGLIGNWLFIQLVNQTGFSVGIIWNAVGGMTGLALAVPWWDLLQIAGFGGIVILLSQPIWSGHWSPRYYWTTRPTLIISSLVAIALGVALKDLGANWWQIIVASILD